MKYLRSNRPSRDDSSIAATVGQPKMVALTGVVGLALVLLGLMLISDADRFGQTFLNGLTSTAIYGIMAIGFTLQYSTVWYFDLSYAAMSTTAAYTILHFHLSRGQEPNLIFSGGVGVLIAVALGWTLYAWLYPKLRRRLPSSVALSTIVLSAVGMGVYTGFLFAKPDKLYLYISPLVGVIAASVVLRLVYELCYVRVANRAPAPIPQAVLAAGGVGATALGVLCAILLSKTESANLPLSAAIGILLVGCLSLVLYRGLFYHLRKRARSPMIMLVASLGVMIMLIALIVIVFTAQAHDLPDPFGTDPINMLGGFVKGFRIFMWGVVIAIFFLVSWLLNKTNWGRTVRAISDDEEVAQVVGINTPVVIAGVFFLGAAIFGLAGTLMGMDTAIRPTIGFIALLKGWIAATIGGLGNIRGAIVGALVLGMIENFGVWWIASDWKDAVAFIVLILFLLFRPGGLLPRR